LRVAIACPGLGRTRRGYERFTQDLARTLAGHADVRVYGGRVPDDLPGRSLPCVPRAWLERAGANPHRAYYWEQVTFGAAMWPALLAWRPDVVHMSDPTLANVYLRVREKLPGRPPFIFCNSGNISPEHWRRYHHVQLVAPWQADDARALGVDAERFTMVPLGTHTQRFRPPASREEARAKLGLPQDKLIALSVASLDRSVKRLDFLMEELARPGALGWAFVAMGQRTVETHDLTALAERLAPGRMFIRAAPSEEVPLYLAAADLFVLASHSEGFGLALLEGMSAKLPAIVRDLPSLRFVVGDDPEQAVPLKDPGDLAPHLVRAADPAWRAAKGVRNEARARGVFEWSALVPQYLELYERAIRSS